MKNLEERVEKLFSKLKTNFHVMKKLLHFKQCLVERHSFFLSFQLHPRLFSQTYNIYEQVSYERDPANGLVLKETRRRDGQIVSTDGYAYNEYGQIYVKCGNEKAFFFK